MRSVNRFKTKSKRARAVAQLVELAHKIDRGLVDDMVVVVKHANKPEEASTVYGLASLGRLCGWMFGLKENGEPLKGTLNRWNRKAGEKKAMEGAQT